jgi:phospho-N-acetylmuramoyl-pentapeptide-transferase
MIIDVVKIFIPAVLAFILGIGITSPVSDFLYAHKMWKHKAGKKSLDGTDAVVFNELHKEKEINTPRMGGIIIWVSVFITVVGLWLLDKFTNSPVFDKLDLLSRNQTWIPFMTLMIGAVIGLVDDYLTIKKSKEGNGGGGLSLSQRLIPVIIVGLFCGYWFYAKLGISTIGTPGIFGGYDLGIFFILFFALITLATYSGTVIDGLDGLSGGIFATIFTAYAIIAFYQQQINLSAFCFVIVGSILAFLWFNIPPARFYMSETGSMALTITLAVVAFMTDALGGGYGVFVLPIIALPLVLTVGSNLIQVGSKKFRGKKLFKIAPIHHHFEALGWPSYKVVMRYWIIGIISALLGVVLALVA